MEGYYYEGEQERAEYVENRRYRRKHFYNAIREQIEFYLGDVNLSKDRFFSSLIQENGYVDMSVLLKCNKLRRLTESADEIIKALKKSKFLSVSEDGTKIHRLTPIETVENTDENTIYVEHIPPYADHDWLKGIFSSFGKVEYISIPQYKEEGYEGGYNKGYAFIQFETSKCVDKAVKAFQRVSSCLPDNMDPEELLSIKTFKEKETILEHMDNKDMVNEQYGYCNDWPPSKRMKTWEEDFNGSYGEEPPIVNITPKEEVKQKVIEDVKNTEEQINGSVDGNTDEDNSVKSKKRINSKKRKDRRRPIETHGMLILPKKQWKKMRNKYLDTQRNKVKKVKSQVVNLKNDIANANSIAIYKGHLEKVLNDDNARVKYQPGVIIKLTLNDPIVDLKAFKIEARRYSDIQYIDVKEHSINAYFRCTNADAAKQLISLNREDWNMEILRGIEERKYWGKIFQDRREKFTHKIRSKPRGKEKLAKRVTEAVNTHFVFED